MIRSAAIPLLPFVLVQGRHLRATMPPPQPAPGDPFGFATPAGAAAADNPLRILVFGESTVAASV